MGSVITWLGHSTVLIESGGARLLTDPLLRRRVAHLRRDNAVTVPGAAVDAVLLSHVHLDHFDQPSLRQVGKGTTVIVPRGSGRLVSRRGFTDVVELLPGDEHPVGDAVVRATPAEHTAKRVPMTAIVPAIGYEVVGSDRVLFSGDTDRFDGMAELAGADAVLIPISGWGPKLPAGHLNPHSAAESLAVLRPRVAIPIHWGTYSPIHRRGAAPVAPAAEFTAHAAECAPDVEVRVLAHGERTEL